MSTKEYRRKYYEEHREEILEKNKKWREKNKQKFNEIIYKNRRSKAERLRKQGLMYVWRTNVQRERLYKRHNERINQRDKEKENLINDEE